MHPADEITIVITDDHQLLRETWPIILNSHPGFRVVGLCASGEEAIELAEKLKPQIVLIDINMKGMNGFEATQQIIKRSPNTKVIGVSVNAHPSYAKKMLLAGAMGYVTKNSPAKEMIEAITVVSNGKKYLCEEIKDLTAEYILSGKPGLDGRNSLTERELEIIRHIKEGQSSREIAAALGLALKTVEVHRHNMLKKLKLKNSASLVNFANKFHMG